MVAELVGWILQSI